ncbi:MAG: hydrolase [Dehalococcoidales bacterium]|jgi:nicotinamidase-related amidase|nr:hydrolase [Dehalococcoidales bacterium]
MLKLENTALIVIDMQTKLWNVMHEKEQLLENTQKLLKGTQLLGIPIVLTEQNPDGLGPTIPELKQIIPQVNPLPKFCFSCFKDESFARAILELNRKQLLICGIESHICVYQTAMDLLNQGFEVQIIADAISSRAARNREITLMRLQSEGARLTTVEMLLFELLQTARNPQFRELSRIIK